MPLAEAQALLESAAFVPHDPAADSEALQTLAQVCHRFSPFVGIERSCDTDCLLIDMTGGSHLFGGESGLARQVVIDLAELDYRTHVAAAGTIGAAWAIARYGHRAGSHRRLPSLPVEALRIPDDIVSRLQSFDLRTLGQLQALPRESLPSRFGALLLQRLDQMFGQCDELLDPVPCADPVFAEWILEHPTCRSEAVLHICAELLPEVLSTVQSRGEGILRLVLTVSSESADPVSLELGLIQPADSAAHLMSLFQLKLEAHTLPNWMHTIRLEATVTAPLRIRQRGLFAHEEPADDGSIRRLIDRLSARLGRNAVVKPKLLPEAVPEQAVEFEPLADTDSKRRQADSPVMSNRAFTSARPLKLLSPPESIRVISIAPDGPPVRFYWDHHEYQVAQHTEPERIATAWWQETGSVRRDYFQVEVSSGARFWLFRNDAGNWFLHGVFE
jgi:protein ImuB